jgi:hypothetical protein
VGYIGTKSVIERFIKIIELRNVASETYSQLLRFQVDINGGVKPSVSILPSAGRVVNADLDFAAERSDVHKLLLILKPPPPPKISEPEKIIKIQIVGDDRDKAARRAPLGPDRPAARQEAPVAPSTRPNTLTPEEQQDLFRSLRRERSLDVEESILDELREQGTLR